MSVKCLSRLGALGSMLVVFAIR